MASNEDQSVEEVLAQRGQVYGDMVETHSRIADVWSGILGHSVSSHQVALCMVGLKLVRASVSPSHKDSYVDAMGYTRIADTIASAWGDEFQSLRDRLGGGR